MGGSQTKVRATNGESQLEVSHNTSDSPILPIAQIEKLQLILPEKVNWVFDETTREAANRRSEVHRTNTFIFIERMIGQIFALIVTLCAFAASVYCATNGAEITGSIIGGTAVIGLATAFIVGRSGNKSSPRVNKASNKK
jgi:uncharacterized membrane protein